MNPTVQYKNGKAKKVKNLGWLLRHASEVRNFKLLRYKTGGLLIARMLPESKIQSYRCEFADYSIMKKWIIRRVFSGVIVEEG